MADLAAALRGYLVAEERLRNVNNPRPMHVRWDAVRTPRDLPAGDELAGQYADVTKVFKRLPARRLVILGPAGAGKSVLITRLARELLDERGENDPVAVIVPIATWDAEEPFGDWLAGQLVDNHPGLSAHARRPHRSAGHGPVSPTELLRLDRRAYVVDRLLTIATGTTALYVICGWLVPAVYLACAVLALPLRLVAGTAATSILFSASQSYADARFWLALGRRLPWRTMAFLSGAHRRGVLRRNGAVYQFRHLRLQEHLAAKHPRWTERAAPYTERVAGWIAPLHGRLHAGADGAARAAGLTVTRTRWGQRRVRHPGLPARLAALRAAGGLETYQELQAAARRADALAAELDRLKARTRLFAGLLRRVTYAERTRRFVAEHLPPGTDLAEFRWTAQYDVWWTAFNPDPSRPVERVLADARPHPSTSPRPPSPPP